MSMLFADVYTRIFSYITDLQYLLLAVLKPESVQFNLDAVPFGCNFVWVRSRVGAMPWPPNIGEHRRQRKKLPVLQFWITSAVRVLGQKFTLVAFPGMFKLWAFSLNTQAIVSQHL